MSNDANLPYRIVEIAMPEGKTLYFLTVRTEAPFLDNQSLGAFYSVDEILEMWPTLDTGHPNKLLIAEPIKSQHHLDKDYLWRKESLGARVSFRLPLDEFTERLETGVAVGLEARSLIDDLELALSADPEALELQSIEVQKDNLNVVRRVCKGGAHYVQITIPLKITVRWPELYVALGTTYMRRGLTPYLSVGFLGIDSLKGAVC